METELAWAAGFFDARGYVSGRGSRVRFSNEALARRFIGIVRVGTIYGPYTYEPKPTHWIWHGNRREWALLARRLAPYLSESAS